MQLVSMKREDEPADYAPMPSESFPYGLRLRLGKEELEKLGTTELPGIRKAVDIQAKGVVVSVSDDVDGYRCLEIQITDLGLKARASDAAGVLYDKD